MSNGGFNVARLKIFGKAIIVNISRLWGFVLDFIRKKLKRGTNQFPQNIARALLANVPIYNFRADVMLQSPVKNASHVYSSIVSATSIEPVTEYYNGSPVVFHSDILEKDEVVRSVEELDYDAVQEIFQRVKALNAVYKTDGKRRKSYMVWEDSGKRLKVQYVVTASEPI
jgi:hypothetical protein